MVAYDAERLLGATPGAEGVTLDDGPPPEHALTDSARSNIKLDR